MKKTVVFLLVLSVAALAAWDSAAQEPRPRRDSVGGQVEIEEVVVTARGRDRGRRYFRRYVRRVPGYGWYTGFTGGYTIDVDGRGGWRSEGTYERNHIPGDDANRFQIDLFKLAPVVAADSVNTWQIRRNILMACSIAERAADLGYESGAKLSYRGSDEGMNVFTVSEGRDDESRDFRTRLLVSVTSGIVARSESVSPSLNGVWNVTADYAVSDGFIYPTRLNAGFEQRDPLSGESIRVKVDLTDIVPHRFERAEDNDPYWRSSGDTYKRTLWQRIQIMSY